MSNQNSTLIINQFFQALNSSDLDAALALTHDDVVHDINQGPREIGKEKLRWYIANRSNCLNEEYDDLNIMVTDDGFRAAAEYTMRGTYSKTLEGAPEAKGQSYSLRAGSFFELDEGLITRISNHHNLRGWLDQVG